MKPPPMARQMNKPVPMPHQTWTWLTRMHVCDEHAAYLLDQTFVCYCIVLRPQSLLQKREQHRDDDARFQALAHANEEDCWKRQLSFATLPFADLPGTANTFTIVFLSRDGRNGGGWRRSDSSYLKLIRRRGGAS